MEGGPEAFCPIVTSLLPFFLIPSTTPSMTPSQDITVKGDQIRQLKADKATKEVVTAQVVALNALKAEYKTVAGKDYSPPGKSAAAPKKEKVAAVPAAKKGPSKGELKKMEKKEKKQDAKGGAAAHTTTATNNSTITNKASVAVASGPTLYPCEDAQSTHMVLAVAHAADIKLQRGYGIKPGFFGDKGPYLEMGFQVLSGVDGAVRALAAGAASLASTRPAVDDWLEWGFRKLASAVSHASEGEEGGPRLLQEMTVLEGALMKNPSSLLGSVSCSGNSTYTLADLVLAPLAWQALQYFGEHEYPLTREWATKLLHGERSPYAATAAYVGEGGAFQGTNVKIEPRRGLLAVITALFTSALHKAYPELAGQDGFRTVDVAKCSNAAFGDYQCNSPMGIYKALKALGIPSAPARPQDVANALIAALPEKGRKEVCAEVSVAGAGFINVKIQEAYLQARVRDILKRGGPQAAMARKLKVLVDFSSPNIAKEMHVGHLRSTIIGDSLCRMFEFLGHDVMRVNHVGDWGTQFGMLINYLKEEYPDFMTNPPNITDLTGFYKAAKARFDEDEAFKERARVGVVELQAGNMESRAIWNLLCDISRAEFQKVYDRLDVKLEECGESFYNSRIPAAIEDLQVKGLLQEDGGATIMWCGGKHQIPLMVRKSDGGYGYDSTDLAAIKYRLQELDRDWVIYITDAGQATHFHMIFDAARLVGWVDEEHGRHRLDHVGFGVVQGEDGKRFKTRSGDTVRLVDLLDEAVVRMTASLGDRIMEGKSSLTEEEALEAASALGYGAVKYADLKQNPGTDYQFSYDRMLDTKGDTAIYLLFTCARFHSILRKAEEEKGIDVKGLVATGEVVLEHPTERALALELAQFAEALQQAVLELMPNRLTSYVFFLSARGTDFLEACHVLTHPRRLVLVQATAATIARCLELLGIKPLTKI